MSDNSNVKIAFFVIGGIGILGLLIAMVIYLSMNNKNLKELNDKGNKTKEIKIIENKNLTGEHYGEKVSLEYESGKRYMTINISGNFTKQATDPEISMVFSNDGEKWSIPGETSIASLQEDGNKTYYMLQSSSVPFKFVTVLVKKAVNGFNCTISLSN